MKINIKATGIELTPSIAQYAEKKFSTLERFVPEDAVAQVEVGKTTGHHKNGEVFRAEINIRGAGLDVYVASEETDLYAAIDVVRGEAQAELAKGKDKREALHRRGARKIKEALKSLGGYNPFRRR